jgi:Fe2+ transport system protein FeoA
MQLYRLNQIKQGEKCIVRDFEGGQGLNMKLNALGIVPGREILKISDSFIGGPVTVQVINTKIAIGKNMATKILVEMVD